MHPAAWQHRPAIAGTLVFLIAVSVAPIGLANQPPESSEQGTQAESFGKVHDRGVTALLAHKLEEALREFDRAIAIDPTVALAYYNRGNVRLGLKDKTGAIADYSEAIRLRPDFALAYMNRGTAYSNLWRLDEALADMDQAVRLEPELADVFYNRAIVLLRRGDTSKAMNDYTTLLKLDGAKADSGAEARLKILQGRQDGEYMPDDPSRLTSELAHARMTEFMLTLLERSCLTAGGDSKALAEVAQKEGWFIVPRERLQKEQGGEAVINAWMFKFLESAFYVVQSASTEGKVVCSVSSMPVTAHLLGDFKDSISHRFEGKLEGDISEPGRLESRFVLSTSSTTEPLDLQVIHRSNVRFLTLRTVHRQH